MSSPLLDSARVVLGLGVAAGAEGDEVFERVAAALPGGCDVVDAQSVGGSARDAAVAISESDRSADLLPRCAVEMWPARTGSRAGAGGAAADGT